MDAPTPPLSEQTSVSQEKKLKNFKEWLSSRDPHQKENINSIDKINISESELWDSIGIHKSLGGNFFRNFTFMLLETIISVALFTFVLEKLIPFPISKGYYDISHNLFGFVWLVFDIGTAYGIERFIAEYMVKDKRKMLKYVQFYIWYQMWTGLIQITIISIWIFRSVPYGNLAYLAWLMLIINAKQWPGMLGTFQSVLKGMQAYNKAIIVRFISNQGFQFITEIIFLLAGRYWGMANPEIGEILGLSIGMVFGYYVDDFFSMGLAMFYFGKAIQQFGFRARQAWGHDFDWSIIKECLRYGIGLSWAPLIGVGIGLIQLTMSLEMVPGYANWIVLAGLGSGIASSMNMGGDIDLTSCLSESLNNNKKELSSFYLEQSFKYWAFLMFAMGGVLTVILPIFRQMILLIPSIADQYENTLIFIIPGVFSLIWDVPKKQLERVIVMAGRVWLKSFLELAMTLYNLLQWYLFLFVWKIWEWGAIGIIILFVLAAVPSKILTLIVYIWYVQTKLIKIRIAWYQNVGASLFTYFVVLGIGYFLLYSFFLPLLDKAIELWGVEIGLIVIGIFAVVIISIGFLIFIFPFSYALAGGWDAFSLETLRKSYLLSGPSKPFIYLLYKSSVLGSRISPLYNKFGLNWQKAFKEAEEILQIKKLDDLKLKQELLQKGHIELF